MEYRKPIVVSNDNIAEVISAASGEDSGDCWEVGVKSVQDWNGSHHVYEPWANHKKEGVKHISSAVDYTFTFSQPLTDFYSEFPSTFSGNTGTVHRELLADAYQSGDRVTFKIWAKTADEASTKALAEPSVSWSCTHAVNVQGDFD